jgi:hypothetical protein
MPKSNSTLAEAKPIRTSRRRSTRVRPPGCVLNLTDSTYALPREIWMEEKNSLTIQPSAQMKALKIRPRLYYNGAGNEFLLPGTAANPTDPQRPSGWKKWPIKSTKETGAGAGGDTGVTANPYSTSGFQNNGYIVVYKSTNITIDGIAIDGKKPITFVNSGIWCSDKCYDVFFGNVGINLFESKRVVVRGTEIKNCFAGIYIQNRNVGWGIRRTQSQRLGQAHNRSLLALRQNGATT